MIKLKGRYTEAKIIYLVEKICGLLTINLIKMGNTRRAVKQISLDGKQIAVFDKMKDAAKKTGTNYGSIANCCRGKIKTANGFIWKYDNSKLKLKQGPLDKLLFEENFNDEEDW